MKLKLMAAAVAAALLGLTGCAGMSDREMVGTAGGAVLGGVVGDAVLGTPGAIGGAAAGGYLGREAGRR
jgi:osmotically inducible lipoprotein OsmB